MNASRGFTLIEMVIVMFLGSMVLLVASRLAHETLQSLRFLEEKAETVQSATLGLERLSSELREAVKLHTADTSLAFDKVDPNAPYALDYDKDPSANPGDPAPDFPPLDLSSDYEKDALAKNQLGRITYFTDGERLLRRAEKGAQILTSQVASSVNTFLAEPGPTVEGTSTGDEVVEITLTLLEERRTVTFKTLVSVPGLKP